MSFAVRLLPEALRTVAASGFTGSYQTFGTPLAHQAALVKFVNNTSVTVTVSWNGTTDHDVYPMGSFTIYDVTSNTQRENGLYIAKGTQFYVKAAAGTGSIYLIVLYPAAG